MNQVKITNWLYTLGVLPKLVSAALQYVGIKEIPGSKSNPVILDMARGLGIEKIYKNDDTEWCALFVNHLIGITGKPLVDIKGDPYNYLRALWLLNWGEKVDPQDAKLGDVVILKRAKGGHVFILLGFAKNGNPVGIGGNQSNSVTIAEFDEERVKGYRRYYATAAPASAKRYLIESEGNVSTNES